MRYVDGYLLPVPKRKVAKYRRMARKAGKIWMEHGALEYRECVGDDLAINGVVPFTRQMKVKPGETVIFAWIVYQSKADRNRVNAKVARDPRMQPPDPKTMPFDVKRMVYGGFAAIVDLTG